MKKNFYLLAVLFISSLTVFSACSDDDDNGGGDTEETVKDVMLDATAYDKWMYFSFKDGTSVAHEIEPVAGTYKGDISGTVMGQDQGTVTNLKLEVGRISKDSVSITVDEFSLAGRTISKFTAGAKIAADSIGWDLAGGEMAVSGMTVTPTTGNISLDSINITILIQPTGMPMPITTTYKGIIETRTGIDETSFNWDIALHRYDVKTNGASAVETTESDIKKVTAIPSSGYVADIKTDSLIIDNSGMMNNKVGYATSNINEVLNKGIEFSSVPMPPTPANWTMSDKVYVIKLSSGEYAKIKFTDYSNDADVKGHISFDYVYPFK